MAITLTNSDTQPTPIVLHHAIYCAQSGDCRCHRIASQQQVTDASTGNTGYMDVRKRLPYAFRLEVGATSLPLHASVLQQPDVRDLIKSGRLTARPASTNIAEPEKSA